MGVVRDIALCVVGIALIAIVVDAALRTFVLPRGSVVRLTRVISVVISRIFELVLRPDEDLRDARPRDGALRAGRAHGDGRGLAGDAHRARSR